MAAVQIPIHSAAFNAAGLHNAHIAHKLGHGLQAAGFAHHGGVDARLGGAHAVTAHIDSEIVAVERNAIQLAGQVGAVAALLAGSGAGPIAIEAADVERNAAALVSHLAAAVAQIAGSGAVPVAVNLNNSNNTILPFLTAAEREAVQIASRIGALTATFANSFAVANPNAGAIFAQLAVAERIASQIVSQIAAINVHTAGNNGVNVVAQQFGAIAVEIKAAEHNAAHLAGHIRSAAAHVTGVNAHELAAAERNATLLASQLSAIAASYGAASFSSNFSAVVNQLAIADRQAVQLSAQIGIIGAGIVNFPASNVHFAGAVVAQLSEAQRIAAHLAQQIGAINFHLAAYNATNAAAIFGGAHQVNDTFKQLEHAYSNELSQLATRPANYLEKYSMANPVRIDAAGNRWLNYYFDVKSFKPEEVTVTLNAKERSISVEAQYDIKDKEHYVKRNYSRKVYVADDIKVDLSKIDLKSFVTSEGTLVVEAELPKISLEEARAWSGYGASLDAAKSHNVPAKLI